MVENSALVNYLRWGKEHYLTGNANSCFALFSHAAFDLSVTTIYLPLLSGSKIKLYAEGVNVSLARLPNDVEINCVKLTPAHLEVLANLGFGTSKLSTLIVGGESLKGDLAYSVLEQLD